MIFFGITQPDTFLTWTTFKLVFVENVIVAVLALAFLVPLATGTYDLSIGAMMSMSLVITVALGQGRHDADRCWRCCVALSACAIAGFLSGFFVVKLGVNSFIATLGMSEVSACPDTGLVWGSLVASGLMAGFAGTIYARKVGNYGSMTLGRRA